MGRTNKSGRQIHFLMLALLAFLECEIVSASCGSAGSTSESSLMSATDTPSPSRHVTRLSRSMSEPGCRASTRNYESIRREHDRLLRRSDEFIDKFRNLCCQKRDKRIRKRDY